MGTAREVSEPVEAYQAQQRLGGTVPVTGTNPGVMRKLALVVPLALLALYLVDWVITIGQMGGFDVAVRRADFVSALTGAGVIYEGSGTRLYDLEVQREVQNGVLAPYFALDPGGILPYNHLPFEALLITPLMGLPYTVVFGGWLLLMALAVGLSLWVMQAVLPIPRVVLPVMVLAAISYQPLFRSFVLGQNSPLVLLGLCGTYAALRSGRENWAGAVLLLVALKPQILPVVVLLLLLQRHWKTLAVFAGLLAALCVAVMPILGATWPVEYARLLLGVANWQDTGAIDPAIMHNWRGFATNLVGGVAPQLVTPLFALLALASVGLLVWVWLKSQVTSHKSQVMAGGLDTNSEALVLNDDRVMRTSDLLWALTGVVAVLTSLHLNPHDLTLLIFPAWIAGVYATSGFWSKSVSSRWLYLLWAGYALIPLTFYLTGPDLPGMAVVSNVLLMSAAALLLAGHVVRFERLNV